MVAVSQRIPIFPLNSVVFPGAVVPLFVFENRYRSMVQDLVSIPDPLQRRFVILAIRDGYEVGDHGSQSLYTVGTLVQLQDVAAEGDGSYRIEATALSRIRVLETDQSGEYLLGRIESLIDSDSRVSPEVVQQTTEVFARYRSHLVEVFGSSPILEALPRNPHYLSYVLASESLLTLPQRQALLEEPNAASRLLQLVGFLSGEMRAMLAIPSLPATELARTRWSPN